MILIMAHENPISYVNEAPPESRNSLTRLRYIRRTQGFLPVTKDEISYSFGVISYAYKGRGTDDQLNDIFIRQYNVTSKGKKNDAIKVANRTVDSITRTYRGYQRNANNAFSLLDILSTDIESSFPNLNERSSQTLSDGYTRDNYLMALLLRFRDLSKLATDGAEDISMRFNPLTVNYASSNRSTPMAEYMDDFLSNTTLWSAWSQTDAAMEDQFARREFWTARAVEAESFGGERRKEVLGALASRTALGVIE